MEIGEGGFFGFGVAFKQGYLSFGKGIPKSSPVYAAAAEMKEGQCVIFSGKVQTEEKSITESGAVNTPEFGIRFSSIKPCP